MSMRSPRITLLLVLASASFLASPSVGVEEPEGWRHIMQVEDSSGRIVKAAAMLASRPRSFLRLDGVQVPGFTPEDGLRIAESLRAAGIDDDRVLVRHLLGMSASENRVPLAEADQAAGPAGRDRCPLTIVVGESDGTETRVRVELEGGYVTYVLDATDPENLVRVRRFSLEDALRIKTALNARGFGDEAVMNAWLGLVEGDAPEPELTRMERSAVQATAVWARSGYRNFEPLNPGCNQCLPGTNCQGDCCVGLPQQCESCRICP